VSLHPPGETVEAAGDVGDGCRRGDLAANGGQGGGQQGDRRRHAEQDDPEAGDPEGGEDGKAEHEEPAHRHRDGESGEHHCLAGGRDGLHDGVVQFPSPAAFLAESADHQESVVDTEADAEHVDDVDREDRHVTEHGRSDEHSKRRQDAGEGDEHRHAGSAKPAQQEDHCEEGDRQSDRFAAEEIVLGGCAELLSDEHVPADEDLRGIEVSSDIGDLMRQRHLGLLVESAGDGDDGKSGAAIAGTKGV
jgi:hypothetical protein